MRGRHHRRGLATTAGLALVLSGLALMYGTALPLTEFRGSYGYRMTEPFRLETSGRAIVVDDPAILRGDYRDLVGDWPIREFITPPAEVKVEGLALGPGGIFIGIAQSELAASYLAGSDFSSVTGWNAALTELADFSYEHQTGPTMPGRPSVQPFWVATASGRGGRSLEWTIEPGNWSLVIMSADASPGVAVLVATGASVPRELKTALRVALGVGTTLLMVGAITLETVAREARRNSGEGYQPLGMK